MDRSVLHHKEHACPQTCGPALALRHAQRQTEYSLHAGSGVARLCEQFGHQWNYRCKFKEGKVTTAPRASTVMCAETAWAGKWVGASDPCYWVHWRLFYPGAVHQWRRAFFPGIFGRDHWAKPPTTTSTNGRSTHSTKTLDGRRLHTMVMPRTPLHPPDTRSWASSQDTSAQRPSSSVFPKVIRTMPPSSSTVT